MDYLKEWRDIIKQFRQDCDNDVNETTEKVIDYIEKNNPELAEELKHYFFYQATLNEARSQRGWQRHNSWYGKNENVEDKSESVPTLPKGVSGKSLQKNKKEKLEASQKIANEILMNMPLNNSSVSVLKHAGKDDLNIEMQIFGKHAKNTEAKALFFYKINNELEDNEIVEGRFSESDLQKLKEFVIRKMNKKYEKYEVNEELELV